MGFTAIPSRQGIRKAPVMISARHKHGGVNVRVTLSKQFASQVGWAERMKLEPAIGFGPDEGYLRIKPASGKGFGLLAYPGSSRLVMEFPVEQTETWALTEAEHTFDSVHKALTIRLPWSDRKLRVG